MKKRFIAFLLCFAMVLPILPVYAVTEDAVCTCGTETDVHAETCALYVAPAPVCTCDAAEGEAHKEGCALYVAPVADEETEAPSDPVVTDETEMPSDPVADLFNRLMSATTYEELDAMMENMTEEEYELLAQFSDEQNAALTDKSTKLLANVTEVFAANVTVEQGSSVTYTYSNASSYNWRVLYNNNTVNTVTVSVSGNIVTVTASESARTGTYTVQYKTSNSGGGSWNPGSGSNNNWSNAFTVEVAEAALTGTVKVYVYVATKDPDTGDSWVDNEEFTDLIGLYVADPNDYFPVGEITLDRSFLTGKSNIANYQALITEASDWDALITALSELDTTKLVDDNYNGYYKFSQNNQNKVATYLEQAARDVGYNPGQQHSALFKWETSNHSYGFIEQNVSYHLDLRFNVNRITFKTGNNGLTQAETSTAYDGIEVDYRAYITGSTIQKPKQVIVPDGYRFVGYYKDANFTEEWDGIGKSLNEDQVVYIKITELDNVILNYVVAEGNGTVSPDSEGLNPETGVAVGSTATAGAGYEFEGWYSDATCTIKVDDSWVADGKITPTKDSSTQWTDATYYAKFVPTEYEYTINYLDKDSNNVLKAAETKKANYGSDVTETYPTIENYTYDSTVDSTDPADDGKITIAVKGNVITFYYVENTVTLNYKIVNPDGAVATDTTVGSVDLNDGDTTGKLAETSETVKVVTGTVVGATAEASSDIYKFVGWYSDEACTKQVSTSASYTPDKPADGKEATYYAKFEYNLTKMTITKTLSSASSKDESFVFTVSGGGLDQAMTVVIKVPAGSTSASVTIDGLTVGESVTVTETDFNRDYTLASSTGTITLGVINNTVSFSNKPADNKWLSESDHKVNKFVD